MKDSILQPEVNNTYRSRRRWISKGKLISGSIWYFLFPKTWSGAKSGQHVQYPPFQSIYIYIYIYTFRFFKFLSSIQVTYKGLQRHNGFVSLPWPQVDIDRSATLNILELKKSGDLWQVGGSGYFLWESGWNKEPFCIHMLLCVQC